MAIVDPSQAYGVNFQELKSHSSFLTNVRIDTLMSKVDFYAENMNETYHTTWIKKQKSVLRQLWKNIRSLIEYNAIARASLKLSTQINGVYTLDVAFWRVEKMVMTCELNGFTLRTNFELAQQLNSIETALRSIMQYFSYNFRMDGTKKPDVLQAANEYKKMADQLTIQQLRAVVGENNLIDFGALGIGGGDTRDVISTEDVAELVEEENE